MVALCAKAWGVSCKLQGYRFQDKSFFLLFTAVDPVHAAQTIAILQYDARHARMVAGCRASSRGCSAMYILLRRYFVLLRLAQAILSCMPQAPPCSGGARGGDAASCSCNTADAACDVARRRRSDGGCSTGWQCLAWPCWLCPKHKACTRDTAGNATSCKRFYC